MRSQRGFGAIEMMISLVIVLLLTLVYMRSQRHQEAKALQQTVKQMSADAKINMPANEADAKKVIQSVQDEIDKTNANATSVPSEKDME